MLLCILKAAAFGHLTRNILINPEQFGVINNQNVRLTFCLEITVKIPL
jgi:hypothetical protein